MSIRMRLDRSADGRRSIPFRWLEDMDSVVLAAFDVLLTITGRFAVWVFSLGRWRGEALGSDEGRVLGPAGALSFIHDGRRVITHTGQLLAGLSFYVALATLGIAYAVAV